jgi:antitoxin (DNA-binding transcriptional repressor) of toxin-antitoxin stability system
MKSDNLINVKSLSATDAARRFSELLDAVERRGESFLVLRRGHAVARIEPARAANGRLMKEILRSNPADGRWAEELHELRESLAIEERHWSG